MFGDFAVKDYSARELYEKASEKYEIFHIVMKAGAYGYQNSGEDWKKLIGSRAVELDPEDLDVLPEIFVSLMQAVKGVAKEDIISQWSGKAADTVREVLKGLNRNDKYA